jgi:HD domain
MPKHLFSPPIQPRRRLLMAILAASVSSVAGWRILAEGESNRTPLPKQVADISLPESPVALAAADLARAACPPFLFNHCMRTFLFGALLAENQKVSYDGEMIFVAAALHDLGLTTKYATAERAFEMDGADAAKAFLVARGVPEIRAELVWNAIALHTSNLVDHQAPQVGLVGSGAGADVFGSGIGSLRPDRVHAVLAAFPRLSFNTEFRDLLVDHCHRKPFSQRGTWLDHFCRVHNPGVVYPDLEKRMLDARIAE